MIIGKKEQERLEREQCAQISLLCRQKLMGYAESFEELGKSFRQRCSSFLHWIQSGHWMLTGC